MDHFSIAGGFAYIRNDTSSLSGQIWGALGRKGGLFSTDNARLSIRRVVASKMNCRMNVRPPD